MKAIWQVLVLSVIVAWSSPASGQELALKDVLPNAETGEATREIAFEETQSSPALEADLRSSGTLIYEPTTGTLTKQVTAPVPAQMIVEGDMIRMVSGGRSRTISLRKRPEVRVFFDSLRALLTGDEETLRGLFSIEVTGSQSNWTVHLKPLHERLRRLVSSLLIVGSEKQIISIETNHGNDESRLMTFVEPGQ